MRLTCPNCGAQYEVPDEVIPQDGRDVQCSNCGNTWFQAHPDQPEAAAETQTPQPEPTPSEPQDPAESHQMDPEVADILREEAERETRLRASETGETLESQPDLGLDDIAGDETPDGEPESEPEPVDETARRAREASERMARMRGQEPDSDQEPADPPEPADPGSRRDLLPDIDEINSSLRGGGDGSGKNAISPVLADQPRSGRGGFVRGFSLVLILGVILALIYINAPKISQAVPQADPVLASYVGMIDQARVWLDSQLNQFLPQ